MVQLFPFRKKKDPPATPIATPTSAAGLPVVRAEEIVNALFDRDGPKPDASLFVVDKQRGGARNLKALYVAGRLDLSDSKLDHGLRLSRDPPLTLNGCEFEHELSMQGARVGSLDLRGAKLPGIQAGAVRVDGALDLSFAEIEGQVALGSAKIEGDLLLNGASISFVSDDETAAALLLSGATIQGNLLFNPLDDRRFKARGMIEAISTNVIGAVSFSGAECRNPGRMAIQCEGISVGASLFMQKFASDRFEVEGAVSFMMAHIKGGVSLADAKISHRDGIALGFEDAEVGGVFYANRADIEGLLNLIDAEIAGVTQFSGASFTGDKSGIALTMAGATIGANLFLDRDRGGRRFTVNGRTSLWGLHVTKNVICRNALFRGDVVAGALNVAERLEISDETRFEGRLSLQNASVNEIDDRVDSWPDPGNLILDGLVYNRFGNSQEDTYARGAGAPSSADRRLQWLKLQPSSRSNYAPIPSQPYVQLARVLRAMGQKNQATRVLARLESHRLWHDWPYLLDPLIPTLAFCISYAFWGQHTVSIILLVVTAIFVALEGVGANLADRVGWHDFARALRRKSPIRGLINWLPRFVIWATAGHGYYPVRALFGLALLASAGWYVFDMAHTRGLMYPLAAMGTQLDGGLRNVRASSEKQEPTYPEFDPFVYSLNAIMPFLDLHQLSYWAPIAKGQRPECPSQQTSDQVGASRECPALRPLTAYWPFHGLDVEPQPPSWFDPGSWWDFVRFEFYKLVKDQLDRGSTETWLIFQMISGLALSVIFAAGFAGVLEPKEE